MFLTNKEKLSWQTESVPREAMRSLCVELGPDLAEMSKDLRTTAVAGVYDAKVSCGSLLSTVEDFWFL